MSLDLGPCKKSKKSKFLKRILDYSGHHGPSLAKFWLKNGGPFRAKASGRAEIYESKHIISGWIKRTFRPFTKRVKFSLVFYIYVVCLPKNRVGL